MQLSHKNIKIHPHLFSHYFSLSIVSYRNNCINCHTQFGEYHCSTCNLWMSADEKPYHCEDCGFCRIGGRENFRHCHDCGMCIAESIFDEHDCKEGRYKSSCPVCQEDLFTSRSLSHGMQCGHAIHWHCFQELIKHDSRCKYPFRFRFLLNSCVFI